MRYLTLPLLALITRLIAADNPAKDPTFLDPASAGPDYRDQGEYQNDWGGAQIIALGDGSFRMVTYRGGLPGDGWDKEFKQEISGKRDGGTADAWTDGHVDDRELLQAGCKSKQGFTNFTAHLEFLLPFKPLARGQERGNSGIYLQDRYELQVLDSFGLKGENDDCGGFYSLAKPSVNMCFPPLTWQTYDIDFVAAQFDASGARTKNAMVMIRHNGVPIYENLELKGPTPGGKKESAAGGPLQLQGHGNPVFYRNIWVVAR